MNLPRLALTFSALLVIPLVVSVVIVAYSRINLRVRPKRLVKGPLRIRIRKDGVLDLPIRRKFISLRKKARILPTLICTRDLRLMNVNTAREFKLHKNRAHERRARLLITWQNALDRKFMDRRPPKMRLLKRLLYSTTKNIRALKKNVRDIFPTPINNVTKLSQFYPGPPS